MRAHLTIASLLAYLLENSMGIGKFRFGLSALIDLIPWIGDIIDAVLSFYIVWIAKRMKVPDAIIQKMIRNIAINFIFGLVPVVGDAVYFLRKVNLKNLALLKEHASTIVEGEITEEQGRVLLHKG